MNSKELEEQLVKIQIQLDRMKERVSFAQKCFYDENKEWLDAVLMYLPEQVKQLQDIVNSIDPHKDV